MSILAPPPLSVASHVPPELAAELLAIARAGGAEYADLYAEHTVITSFVYEERRLKTSQYSVHQGVGVRAIRGAQTGYAYADGFAARDVREAARVAARIARDASPEKPPAIRAWVISPDRSSDEINRSAAETACSYYGRLQKPKTDNPTTTWSLAQRWVAQMR